MFAAYLITTVVTIAANAWAARADLAQPKWLLANMDDVGVPRSWLLPLAARKGAGAAGLLLGLLGVRSLGIAAAAGLVLFFTGALTAHVRARAFHNIAFPGAYLAGHSIRGPGDRRPLTPARCGGRAPAAALSAVDSDWRADSARRPGSGRSPSR